MQIVTLGLADLLQTLLDILQQLVPLLTLQLGRSHTGQSPFKRNLGLLIPSNVRLMETLADVSTVLPTESEETLSPSLPDLEDPGRLVFIFLSQGQVSQGKLRPAQSLQTGG